MHSSIQQIIKNSPHLAWMEKGLLYLCLHGSKAYNCHTETSDDDFKGITLVPRSILHGFLTHFDQAELKDPNPDTVIYNIKKFFNLAVGNNPNLLEMLYVNPEHQLYIHPLMEKILEHRKEFLSTKVRFSFGGFAFSQMKRVRHHRAWLLNPMKEPPTRDEMGLPPQPEIGMENLKAAMAAVDKELDKFNFNFMTELDNDQRIEIKNAMHEMLTSMQIFSKDMFTAACKKIGMDDNLILIMQKEREYKHRQEEWRKYCEWKTNRNEKRAADEAKYGYDLKFGYHIVRLYNTCKEILTEGKVNVYRQDRDEIMKVRRGEWTFEQLEEFTQKSDAELEQLYKTTTVVPRQPNVKFLDKLCQEIIEQGLNLC